MYTTGFAFNTLCTFLPRLMYNTANAFNIRCMFLPSIGGCIPHVLLQYPVYIPTQYWRYIYEYNTGFAFPFWCSFSTQCWWYMIITCFVCFVRFLKLVVHECLRVFLQYPVYGSSLCWWYMLTICFASNYGVRHVHTTCFDRNGRCTYPPSTGGTCTPHVLLALSIVRLHQVLVVHVYHTYNLQ